MKEYIVVRNYAGEIGEYPVDSRKPISDELIRVIQSEKLIFEEGDAITFETR